jgi:T3SS negative regulator,GrlR
MEGLWTAEFGSSTGISGGGVAVFREGKVWGGDATYYYIGDYALSGKAFKATLRISPFIEGAQSVFNTAGKDLTLELEGTLTSEGQAIAQGRPKGMPGLTFGAKLTKRAP